ncbi:MAG: PAS domain S-box protein [Bacteroidetes bacterium]|nr:PAS domain S-box protein [Bacteroidota bacterium]
MNASNEELSKQNSEFKKIIRSLEQDIQVLESEKVTNLEDIDKSLKLSNEKFRILIKELPLAIFILQDNKFVYVNETFYKLIGFNEKDFDSIFFWDIVHPDFFDKVREIVIDSQKQEVFSNNYEFIIRNKAGENVWIDFSVSYLKYEGKPSSICTSYDITKRKQFEKQILESEEFYNTTLDSLSENIHVVDENLRIIHINKPFLKYCKTFGLTTDFINRTINDVFPFLQKNIYDEYKEVFETGKQIINETEEYLNSKIAFTETIKTPVFKDNKVEYVITTIRDITRRKQIKKALIENEEKYRTIFENASVGLLLIDTQGNILDSNTAMNRLIDSPSISATRSINMLTFHMIKNAGISEVLRQTIKEKKSIISECVYTSKLGKKVYLNYSFAPIFDIDGNLTKIQAVAQDITMRKQIEQDLKKSEERYRSLIQNSTDSVIILDTEGKILFKNFLCQDIIGYKPEDIKNHSIFDYVYIDDVEIFKRAFKKSINSSEEIVKIDFRAKHKYKKSVYVESLISNRLNNTSINGIVLNTRNITERKLAELKEHEYQEKQKFLSKSALEFLSLSDKDEIFRFIGDELNNIIQNAIIVVRFYKEENNKLYSKYVSGIDKYEKKITRITGEKPINNSIHFKKEFSKYFFTERIKILDKDEIENSLEFFLNTAIKLYIKPYDFNKVYNIGLLQNGKILGNVTIITKYNKVIPDIELVETFISQASIALYRIRLEDELIKAKDRAEESDRLKSTFLANMSHEIRTPMNSILGFSDLLKDQKIESKKRNDYVEIINRNGKSLLNIIDDIIDISKIESNQIKIYNSEYSLNLILLDLYSFFKVELLKQKKKNVDLRLNMGFDDLRSKIIIDGDRLKQILNNIIGNALKFTHEGYIEFGYELINNKIIKFYVKDTGIGIEKEKIDIVFYRFRQIEESNTRKYGGTGLGLAISKNLVELMKGRIWIESEIGKGSSIFFTLPYLPGKRNILKKALGNRTSNEFINKTILIIDDDKFNIKYLAEVFKKKKANVLLAINLEEAIDICERNETIDIVLLDLQFSKIEETQLLKKIKVINNKCLIIIQSANILTKDEKDRYIIDGVDCFIAKPIKKDILFDTIKKNCRK